jgi:flagellar basal body rod protein FlgC
MNLFGMLELSGSALGAERQRAEVVASNMANAQTTRTPQGGPRWREGCSANIPRLCAWPRWSQTGVRR